MGITVVKLEDNQAGHAAGWNPPHISDEVYTIQFPVHLEVGTLIEAMFLNPSGTLMHPAGDCALDFIDTSTDRFGIICVELAKQAIAGATLTYIVTK